MGELAMQNGTQFIVWNELCEKHFCFLLTGIHLAEYSLRAIRSGRRVLRCHFSLALFCLSVKE